MKDCSSVFSGCSNPGIKLCLISILLSAIPFILSLLLKLEGKNDGVSRNEEVNDINTKSSEVIDSLNTLLSIHISPRNLLAT